MARNDYGPLREAHQQALDALNTHLENQQPAQEVGAADRGPTRPEGHYQSQAPGWSADPRMEMQQASANEWHKAAQERQSGSAERDAARDALNQHIERGDAGVPPERTADLTRKPENDIER